MGEKSQKTSAEEKNIQEAYAPERSGSGRSARPKTPKRTRKQIAARWIFYICGMLILALGIMLNTKSGFGVSAIISVAYAESIIHHLRFGDATLIMYLVLVVIELLVKGRKSRLYDLLQIPLSIVFTRCLNLFEAFLPDVTSIPLRVLCLILGVMLTGVGAAMNLNARLVPNPGDGIVQAIADRLGKRVGNVKNVVDLCCVSISLLIGFVSVGKPVGVGIGTIASMIGVGRFMWTYNTFFQKKQLDRMGMEKL